MLYNFYKSIFYIKIFFKTVLYVYLLIENPISFQDIATNADETTEVTPYETELEHDKLDLSITPFFEKVRVILSLFLSS